MSDGVLYKSDGNAWTKSVCKDTTNGDSPTVPFDDGLVKHCNGSAWFTNYPMEQLYEQYFNALWTHGYKYGTGQILDEATWGNHPRCGDATADFCGMWGFDNAAIKTFVGSGIVKQIQIEVMFDDPTHSGTPSVYFSPHTYKQSTAPGSFSKTYVDEAYKTTSVFGQTGADYTRWIVMPVGSYKAGAMGGIFVHATATAGNSARYAGKTTSNGLNGFNTRLWIQVLK